MQLASEHHEISCLLSMKSENDASYMFHTPNIGLTELQAEALDIPLITGITKGEKELELSDLKDLIKNAIELFGIEGIVTGAVESVYQAQRVQKICSDLGLWCFNPLWQMDQIELLETLVRKKYNIIISAIAAYPLNESWLGRKLDSKMISELKALTGVNPAGEGGEFESLVLNAPMFKREIKIIESEKEYDNHAGVFIVKEADLR